MGGVVLVIWLGLFVVLPTSIAKHIGEEKDRPGSWWWGLVLGWLGVLILYLLPPGIGVAPKRCSGCRSLIHHEATRCRYCGQEQVMSGGR